MDHHLPNYQLDEISLLRNLSEHQSAYDGATQQHHQHHNHNPQHHHQINASSSVITNTASNTTNMPTSGAGATSNSASTFGQFHGNIDMLFQQSTNGSPHMNSYFPISSKRSSQQQIHHDMSPHYQAVSTSTPQNDCFEQEDILTPLISPAITPSHNYRQQVHQKNPHHPMGNDINFSPLSSPAMLPHENHINGKAVSTSSLYHEQQQQSLDEMSANQICEQYEQLEQAKIMITQKLTELQKSQYDYNFNDRNMTYQRNDTTDLVGSKADTFADELDASSFLNSSHVQLPQDQLDQQNQMKRNQITPIYSTHVEPATPASLMNMKRDSVRSNQSRPRSSPTTMATKGKETLAPSLRSRMINKKKPPIASSNNHHKKPRREYQEVAPSNSHISPRALKPLLISPTLNPNPRQSAPPTINGNNQTSSSIEDAERILATRSNYQNLMEGKAAALGIAFNSQIKSGLEVRRTAHKAAEQKRRDSLKEWFDRLRREVEEGYVKQQSNLMSRVIKAQELEKKSSSSTTPRKRANSLTDADEDTAAADPNTMKPLSKVLLLQYAYEYITSLKETIAERDLTIEQLKKESTTQDEMVED